MNYQVIPIPEHIASDAREKLISPQYKSLKADVSLATGYGSCRSCLRVFDQGADERIYLTYNSFEGLSDLPDPGPIFIHRNECEPFNDDGFPPDLIDLPLLFEGFGENSELIQMEKVDASGLEDQIRNVFRQDGVKFINIQAGHRSTPIHMVSIPFICRKVSETLRMPINIGV
jgi:hypothetical protein